MRYYGNCRCGNVQTFGSDPPPVCLGCDKCGTKIMLPDWWADNDDGSPMRPVEHDFSSVHKVETDEGEKELSLCKYCHQSRKHIEKGRAKK